MNWASTSELTHDRDATSNKSMQTDGRFPAAADRHTVMRTGANSSTVLGIGLASIVLPLVVHIVGAAPALCSCFEYRSPAEEIRAGLDEAIAVFVGSVVSVDDPSLESVAECLAGLAADRNPACKRTDVEFSVEMAWRGPKQPRFTIGTYRVLGSCGYDFEVGERYLVYGRAGVGVDDSPPLVSWCSRTRMIDEAGADLKILGQPQWRARTGA